MSKNVLLGAVAYDPKVVTIWDGFRSWLRSRGCEMDFVLYSHYERQVEDLIEGRIDLAWNSPLAWVRAQRLATARGLNVTPAIMRDTDRDLVSAVVVRADGPKTIEGLRGRTVAVGAIDSPQATLIPLSYLREHGLVAGVDFEVKYYNEGVGLHGDHVGGERDAAIALRDGVVDAACMLDANLLMFGREGTFASGTVRALAHTGRYDHCNMTVGPAADSELAQALLEELLGMSYADPSVRPLLDLEGLTQWVEGRQTGYAALESAVDETRFYDATGDICVAGYRP